MVKKALVGLVLFTALSAIATAVFSVIQTRPPDVPYVPTPQPVVDEMLKMAQVTSSDVVYDLGCGDGRIVVTAAKKFGARGVGVDIDPERIRDSKQNAQKAGVTDRTRFVLGDLFEMDLRPATVVTLYLLPSVNIKLRPKLFRELNPGTRVVSHDFDMDEWEADETRTVSGPYRDHTLYFWVIPAAAGGIWEWTVPTNGSPRRYSAHLRQVFQKLHGRVTGGQQDLPVQEGRIKGRAVSFRVQATMGGQPTTVAFSGQVDGDTITGTVDISGGPFAGRREWKATRRKETGTGRWRFSVPGSAGGGQADLIVSEKNGSLSAVLQRNDRTETLEQFYMWGGSLFFIANGNGASKWAVSGLVDGNRMTGTFQHGSSNPVNWSAQRVGQ